MKSMHKWTLQNPLLEDFEPVVREILPWISRAGIETYQREGRPPITQATKADRKRFIKLCHRGFAAGQELLIDSLLALKRQQKSYSLKLKEARKSGRKEDAAHIIKIIRTLEQREWVLRSMADFLGLQMLRDEKWKIRRLIHFDEPPAISEEAVEAARKHARLSNAADHLTFSLVTDITSCIHAGDILKVDFSGPKPKVSCIELKEGSINKEITKIVTGTAAPSPEILEMFRARHGDTAIKQLSRVQRQHERLTITEETIKRERGMDISTGKEIMISSDVLALGNWLELFERLIAGVRSRGFAVTEIEGALQIAAYGGNISGDHTGAIGHAIYHMLDPDKPCLLEDNVEIELKQMRDRLEPLINFRSAIYYGDFLTPWALGEDNLILDIVFGRVVVLMHFDPYGLIKLSEKMKLPLRWATKAERAKDAREKEVFQPMKFKHGILVTTANEPMVYVGPGWFKRVLFDFTLPSWLIRGIYHSREDMIKGSMAGETVKD
jgi:hypothetical protein